LSPAPRKIPEWLKPILVNRVAEHSNTTLLAERIIEAAKSIEERPPMSNRIAITPAPPQIDDNVPIPTDIGRGISKLMPFEHLQPGQSFFIPDTMCQSLKGDAYGITKSAATPARRRLNI